MESKNIAAINAKLLDQAIDDKLQSIVSEAASTSKFPVALITLILRRTQHFKAQVGLTKDLAAYRSTDSCLSFCQYVVKTKKPLKIEDATKEPSLPQQLVELYGIRAYYGYPIDIDGVVVGSLCIIDKKPNKINDEIQESLILLSKMASQRLTELSSNSSNLNTTELKAHPEQDKIWTEITNARHNIQIALTDLYPVVKAMTITEDDKDNVTQIKSAKIILADATKSYNDLTLAIAQLDEKLKTLKSKLK